MTISLLILYIDHLPTRHWVHPNSKMMKGRRYTAFFSVFHEFLLQEWMFEESHVAVLICVSFNCSHKWQKKDFEKRPWFLCLHHSALMQRKERKKKKTLLSRRKWAREQRLLLSCSHRRLNATAPNRKEIVFLCSSGLCCRHKSDCVKILTLIASHESNKVVIVLRLETA